MKKLLIVPLALSALFLGCTQEQQNKLGRTIQNYTGVNGVVDIYSGGKLVMRFLKVDKLTTAHGTDDNKPRPYRFAYGYIDKNFNYKVDPDEKKKVYFEVTNYETYIFYENPLP
ncbi:hypothetical protein [Caminibacter pacificus]|uniref:Lipoprotein n=1 Tax=Caminibacter pacificus TaxID=1424653 RepID=A0AAJ4REH2_9BACT|nr:hypothetical protein [Caminibacter pacificus]QCI28164.1 hypothetical protein C6V80_04090 [Caminibacter pacificus]ROR41124.1 hypothetical protein EDC58_0608 [Caminibacter pacificus]